MYHHIGQAVLRHTVAIVVGWGVLLAALTTMAPRWGQVAQDGEFAFLPPEAPSLRAERLYREAFGGADPFREEATPPAGGDNASAAADAEGEAAPAVSPESETDEGGGKRTGLAARRHGLSPVCSSIVIVIHREDRERGKGLQPADLEFIETSLLPRLREIAETTGRGYRPYTEEQRTAPRSPLPPHERIVTTILSRPREEKFSLLNVNDVTGKLLDSENGQSTLVVMQLTTEFLDRSNALLISEVERLLAEEEFQAKKPSGLALDLSGSAVVGRDVLRAEEESARHTETLTKFLVIVLLLGIYRAPLLALIPLITVGLSVELTKRLLSLLAGWGWIGVFTGLEVYVTVVVYGAGVDYCLFLIARYREELDRGCGFGEAICESVRRVGAALATSAGTSIFGIGMMAFADFGKFRQAGIAISLGLTVVLCSALTFTPALLRLCGRWAFWPQVRRERIEAGGGWLPTLSFTRFVAEQRWLERGWRRMAELLLQHPAEVFLGTVLLLLPFAVVGTLFQNHLSYGLLSDLPQNDPSVLGARAVQYDYPAGVTGPTFVLLKHPKFDLHRFSQGKWITEHLVEELSPRLAALGIADIRCQGHPFGLTAAARRLDALYRTPFLRWQLVRASQANYASLHGPHAGQVTLLELVFAQDPFLRDSIGQLKQVEAAIRDALPPEYQTAEIYSIGPTASLRDLKYYTDRDRIRIDVLVVVVVYLLLIALLRRPAICAYLLVTVIFSYLVTIGATYTLFWFRSAGEFAGLDWKIPLFLFTILIAIGEDYNILLMARVTEEQQRHGLIRGVLAALTKTGGIISSCGVIMAATFASLMTGTLMGMVQLGFALAFGVLLDTFVVRPILVPAYLVLLYRGSFGRLGRWLGAEETGGLAEEGEPSLDVRHPAHPREADEEVGDAQIA